MVVLGYFIIASFSFHLAIAGDVESLKPNNTHGISAIITPDHETPTKHVQNLTVPTSSQYTEGGKVRIKNETDKAIQENPKSSKDTNLSSGLGEDKALQIVPTTIEIASAKSNIKARKGAPDAPPPQDPSGNGTVILSAISTSNITDGKNISTVNKVTSSPPNGTIETATKNRQNLTIAPAHKKPLILKTMDGDRDRFDTVLAAEIKQREGHRSTKISTATAHPNLVIPVTITVFVLPLFAVLGYYALKHGREAWKNRHYRRMDFLLDGMYND